MFNPTRDQVRDFFFETWHKYGTSAPLVGLETVALQVLLQHPEHHKLLEDRERSATREYFPETGETNPFLHLSLHLALEEQLSIDQPPGVGQRFAVLLAKSGDRHDALHRAIDCLGEMVWRAQKDKAPPDAGLYLDCLARKTSA